MTAADTLDLDARVAERIASVRRRLDAQRAAYAVKATRRNAGLVVRHRRKLARLGAAATDTEGGRRG